MALGSRVTVGASATKVADAPGIYSLKNTTGVIIELGGPGVTIGSGYELAATTGAVQVTLGVGDSLYAVVAAATQPLQVLKTS